MSIKYSKLRSIRNWHVIRKVSFEIINFWEVCLVTQSIPVLIIDDNEDDTILTSRALRKAEFEPIIAKTESDAYIHLEKKNPRLILLSVGMSTVHFNGSQVCRNLRNKINNQNYPIIFLIGVEEEKIVSEAYDAGASIVMNKDIINAGLLEQSLLTCLVRFLIKAQQLGIHTHISHLKNKLKVIGLPDLLMRLDVEGSVNFIYHNALVNNTLLEDILHVSDFKHIFNARANSQFLSSFYESAEKFESQSFEYSEFKENVCTMYKLDILPCDQGELMVMINSKHKNTAKQFHYCT